MTEEILRGTLRAVVQINEATIVNVLQKQKLIIFVFNFPPPPKAVSRLIKVKYSQNQVMILFAIVSLTKRAINVSERTAP